MYIWITVKEFNRNCKHSHLRNVVRKYGKNTTISAIIQHCYLIKKKIGSEMNFYFIRWFSKRVVWLYISDPWRGDIKHTASFAKYRTILIFMNLVCIVRKFNAKIALKSRGFCDVVMSLLMTSLAKKREIVMKIDM